MLAAQIRSIELQLAVLKARIRRAGEKRAGTTWLGDLYGVLAGTGTSSEEDIDRAQYMIAEESPSAEKQAE